MHFAVELAIVVVVCISYTTADHWCSPDETRRSGVCGSHLADDLGLVCNRNYNKRASTQKQEKPWSQYSNIVMKRDTKQPTVDWDKTAKILDKIKRQNLDKLGKLSMERRKAFSYLSTIRRPGIVCECCVHQCSYSEMLMYCGMEK